MADDDDGGSKDEEEEGVMTGTTLDCKTTLTDKMFEGETGKQFRVQCPTGCFKVKAVVIGTMIYTEDSSICKSAIHSGIGSKDKPSEFILVIANGEALYEGSLQNAISSASSKDGSRSFIFKKAKQLTEIDCTTTAQDELFEGPAGTKYSVKCMADCSKIVINVFGDTVYSADSSICQSAIHFGVLSDKGGELELQIEQGQKQYKKQYKNGVESQEK